MPSADLHPGFINEYLQKEVSLGRVIGLFSLSQAHQGLHLNRFGVIAKGHNTGKWRLIADLSFPPGGSVNDSVDPELCSLT